jgi:long-chain fatty acid transport protein
MDKNRIMTPRNKANGKIQQVVGIGLALVPALGFASGIYRDGAGGRAVALGGASVAQPDVALEAMQANPAGLSALTRPQFQLGVGGALATGEFSNAANSNADLDEQFHLWPEVAFAFPLETIPVTLGVAFIPDAALGAEWNYVDAPGGMDGATSYGLQEHRSEITALRTAFGASWQVTDELAIGAGVGLVYNQNRLHAPYIFQSYPGLEGFKTLLDLETDGFGMNGTLGLTYRLSEAVRLGLSYQTRTRVESEGDANGDAGEQLDNLFGPGVQPDFHYDAEVNNVFPQMASAGLSWQMCPRARAVAQVDWINWADSFDELEVYLNNGTNPDINGVLGTDDIYDIIPLRWEDQFVYRLGLEYQATERVALRLGYAYGKSPVPDRTLTPMTAAIMEHKLSVGAGWQNERYFVDAAYQYSLPSSQNVGTSGLEAGEYSNSRTEVALHVIAVTVGVNF